MDVRGKLRSAGVPIGSADFYAAGDGTVIGVCDIPAATSQKMLLPSLTASAMARWKPSLSRLAWIGSDLLTQDDSARRVPRRKDGHNFLGTDDARVRCALRHSGGPDGGVRRSRCRSMSLKTCVT